MNKLELTQFGVQELDAKEMVEVDGGNWWLLPAFYDACMEFGEGFIQGIKDSYK